MIGPPPSQRPMWHDPVTHAGDFAERYAEQRRSTAAASASRIIEFAGIQPGQRVIDLCCGPGLVSLHIAERVGASGALIGVDGSRAMIDLARANVTAPNASFIVGDARDLPALIASAVDHVVATSAWQNFLLDKERVVDAVQAVLKPGGRFTFDVRMQPAGAAVPGREAGADLLRERVVGAVRAEYPDVTFDERQDFGMFGVRTVDRAVYTEDLLQSDLKLLETHGFYLAARHNVPRTDRAAAYDRHRWRMDYWLSRTVPALSPEARTKVLDRVVRELRSRGRTRPGRGQMTYLVLETR